MTLAGDNSYGGGTELRAGALQVSRDANLGAASSALVFTGGSLATTADFATSRSATLSQTAGIDVAAGTTLAMSGRLSGRAACSRPAPARCGWLARATPMAAPWCAPAR